MKVKLHHNLSNTLLQLEMEVLVHVYSLATRDASQTQPDCFQYHTQLELQTQSPFPFYLHSQSFTAAEGYLFASDDSCSEGLVTRLLTFPMCDTENDLRWDCLGLACETTTIVAQW